MTRHPICGATVYEQLVHLERGTRQALVELAVRMSRRIGENGRIVQCGTEKTWVGSKGMPTNRLHLLTTIPAIRRFFRVLDACVTPILPELLSTYESQGLRYLNHSWFSITPPGGHIKLHTHSNSNFVSGAYFLSAPPDCGGFLFQSPDTTSCEPTQLPVRTDGLYLFRGGLAHSTELNRSASTKIAISFDFYRLDPVRDLPPRDVIETAWAVVESHADALTNLMRTEAAVDLLT